MALFLPEQMIPASKQPTALVTPPVMGEAERFYVLAYKQIAVLGAIKCGDTWF